MAGTRKLRTADFSDAARIRLGEAVARARQAAGHKKRPSFARAAGISVRSLAAIEQAEPTVGQDNLYAVGRALPNWDEDTPRVILEGGPIPSNEPVPSTRDRNETPPPVDLLDEFIYFRKRLGEADFERMFRLFKALNESNRQFREAKAAREELDQPDDPPARAAAG